MIGGSIAAFVLSSTPAHAATKTYKMVASWYEMGHRTADGTHFDPNDPTIAAHKSLPFGTKLDVMNPDTGTTISMIVRDRGPFIKGRDLDVSRGAAKKLGFYNKGVTLLHVTVHS